MIVKPGDRLGYIEFMELYGLYEVAPPATGRFMPTFIADRFCPTWVKQTWWDRLWRRPRQRRAYILLDGRIICSFETAAFYAANPYLPIYYQGRV